MEVAECDDDDGVGVDGDLKEVVPNFVRIRHCRNSNPHLMLVASDNEF